jgi:hypothetical protein
MSDCASLLRVKLETISGHIKSITASCLESARSLLSLAALEVPANTHPVFIAQGSVLQPDFSLSSQNLADNSKIYVIFKKKQHSRRTAINRRGSTILHEHLRLADLSFLPFETCRARHRRRRQRPVLARNDPEVGDVPKPVETIIEKALTISEDPLPELRWQMPLGAIDPSTKESPPRLMDAS